VAVVVFLLLANWLSLVIEKQLKSRQTMTIRMRIAVSKTIRVILLTLAFVVALDTMGIDLTALTVMGGALGVGIGFGLQRIASNFISGFILLYDRSIRPGDVITIGDKFGWIQELKARYIVIRDRDGVDTLVPNENLITSQVVNWSYNDKNVRQKLPVTISYADDPEKVIHDIIEVANSFDRVLKDPGAVCRLMEFGDHGIKLELRYWIQDPEEGVNNIKSDISLGIWKMFQETGVTIPFPQQDVYVKKLPER
jgi:small-conductance mechanosensitive channel